MKNIPHTIADKKAPHDGVDAANGTGKGGTDSKDLGLAKWYRWCFHSTNIHK
jgi:hypothetical protein